MRPVLPILSRAPSLRERAERAQARRVALIAALFAFLLLITTKKIVYNRRITRINSTVEQGSARVQPHSSKSTETKEIRKHTDTDTVEWCSPQDKAVTGWSQLSDTECKQRHQEALRNAVTKVRSGTGTLVFKHVHKAGGTTFCQLAQRNMIAEDVSLPFRKDWTTNCVPYESFLGPHPAVGGGFSGDGSGGLTETVAGVVATTTRSLKALQLGGACFFGFLTPAQIRALPSHYRPLTFVASEGPLPDAIPLDAPFAMITMLRDPLDRTLSSYRWWQFMVGAMPHSPTECRAYAAPTNATLYQWLNHYPDNWMTRELAGTKALYKRDSNGLPLPATRADLAVAKQRLHLFAAVLVMEQWDSSMLLMESLFGWKELDGDKHRAGSRRDSSAEQELAQEPVVLKRLRERNALDVELYEYALELHKAQVRMLDEGPP